MSPPLGFIRVEDRSPEQEAAHAAAVALHVAFSLPLPVLAKGQALRLFDFWKDPKVVADVGFTFSRIHQITGSCVWAGGTNAAFSSIAAQRLTDNPTKAFLPFTLHNYAWSRHYFGDDGRGEGSLGSTFWKSLTTQGLTQWVKGLGGLPDYTQDAAEGLVVGRDVELAWSSWRNPRVAEVTAASAGHTFGATGTCRGVQDIRAMVLNGYGVSFACDRYIGHGAIHGAGEDAYVRGKWDQEGGHQQSVLAVWEHPNDGPLYWAQNNWPAGTYPRDPAGGPVCGVWVTEADVEAAFRYHAEVYGFSRLDWFPAQPELLSYYE